MHKFRKICFWKRCFYLMSRNCLSLCLFIIDIIYIFLSLNNTTCPPYTQTEIKLNPLSRLIWWTLLQLSGQRFLSPAKNLSEIEFFILLILFFSYSKLISAVYIWCSGSTIVGIGSPDPPQFIYDDNEYEDVFLSGKTYVMELIVYYFFFFIKYDCWRPKSNDLYEWITFKRII